MKDFFIFLTFRSTIEFHSLRFKLVTGSPVTSEVCFLPSSNWGLQAGQGFLLTIEKGLFPPSINTPQYHTQQKKPSESRIRVKGEGE